MDVASCSWVTSDIWHADVLLITAGAGERLSDSVLRQNFVVLHKDG